MKKSEDRKEKKQEKIHLCHICGKEINSDQDFEYIKTRRSTEIYLHKDCVRRMRHGRSD